MSHINPRREIKRPYHPPVHIPPWMPGRKKAHPAPLQLPEPAPHEDREAAALISENDEDAWTDDDIMDSMSIDMDSMSIDIAIPEAF